MTSGWVLIGVVLIISALVLLFAPSTKVLTCVMNPDSGAIGYVDHGVIADTLILKIKNDSGVPINGVKYIFGGDFNSGAGITNQPTIFGSTGENTLTATNIGISPGRIYNGTVTIEYNQLGVIHIATASCTGRAI